MLHDVETKPIVSERTPQALDFTDQLHLLTFDVRLIELATGALRRDYNGGGNDIEAIIMACRRLEANIDVLRDKVLPPMPEEEQIRVAELMRDSANEEHAAALRRVERVTGVKQSGAELVAFGRPIARGEEQDEA
jgi:hypothetical protein